MPCFSYNARYFTTTVMAFDIVIAIFLLLVFTVRVILTQCAFIYFIVIALCLPILLLVYHLRYEIVYELRYLFHRIRQAVPFQQGNQGQQGHQGHQVHPVNQVHQVRQVRRVNQINQEIENYIQSLMEQEHNRY